MRQKSGPAKEPAETVVKDIRRATRRHFSAEDKIRIVLEGLRGEDSIAELCRRAHPGCSPPPADAGQDRALASDAEEPHPAGELLSARRSGGAGAGLYGVLQSPALPREAG